MPESASQKAEVSDICADGFWLVLGSEGLRVPYAQFPWFRNATIDQISTIERPSENHLYWPKLDIDLAVESLRSPEAFPLVSEPDL
jgi:hypothetical protein